MKKGTQQVWTDADRRWRRGQRKPAWHTMGGVGQRACHRLALLTIGSFCLPLLAAVPPSWRGAALDADLLQELQARFAFVETASGVLVHQRGEVLTNFHVIYDRRRDRVPQKDILVRIGHRHVHTHLLGYDPFGDLALLQIDNEDSDDEWPAVALSDEPAIGDSVIVLGNPFATSGRLEAPSITTGLISSRHRCTGQQWHGDYPGILYTEALQTDAAVNPGNSGGPLFSATGELLGINGQIRSRHGGAANTGIGLAISTTVIQRFLPHLRRADGGMVHHGILRGLVPARNHGAGHRGARIGGVEADSAAAVAGLEAGDVIIAVDDLAVPTWNRCRGALLAYVAGSEVRLSIRRDDEDRMLVVRLEAYREPSLGLDLGDDLVIDRIDPDGGGAAHGLQIGDRLLAIDDRRLRRPGDVHQHLWEQERLAGDSVRIHFLRRKEGQTRRQQTTVVLDDRYPLPASMVEAEPSAIP